MRLLVAGAIVLALVMEILKALMVIIPMLIVGYVVVRLTDEHVDARRAMRGRRAGGLGGRGLRPR